MFPYEDNFGYYDFDADPLEQLFFEFVRSQSVRMKCERCEDTVYLTPGRTMCARCVEAIEFAGGDKGLDSA